MIAPNGRLLLCEIVLTSGEESAFGKLLDLEMLAVAGGRERTGEEYRELLAAAGFRLIGIRPAQSPVSVIEAEPAIS